MINHLLFRFPTLFFVPMKGKNKPVLYEGGREVDDFIKYIAKHSTNPLSGFTKEGKAKKQKDAKSDL
jgi:protein disulfide-isomerase A3